MSDYTPDRWVVVKITTDKETLYKVFASWYGGYAGSDSWKMNSGIVKVESTDETRFWNYYVFHGYSGSVYRCYKNCYGINGYGATVLQNFIDKADYKIEIMPENTNWKELNYASKV
jgi:hypothetical protein